LVDEDSRDRLFKAVRERIKETDEHERIQMIANAIGDRRHRDLVDIISKIEEDSSWSTALEFLTKAQHMKYSSPMTIGQDKTELEELKFREMVFELLSCRGLEPASIDILDLLKSLKDESSLVDASRATMDKLEQLVIDQIKAGDTLFFDFSENISVSEETVNLLDQTRYNNLDNISINQSENLFNIEPLWYNEYGRVTMLNLGIKGNIVDAETYASILSVLQAPSVVKTKLVQVPSLKDTKGHSWIFPTNQTYNKLHTHLIDQDVDNLKILASRHSVLLLNTLLNEALSIYDNSSSTDSYRKILNYINAHIVVRDIESIPILERLSQINDTRIATTAILAIGTFYNESSASVLVNLFCNEKNDAMIKAVTKAIESVYRKCPEADYVITSSIDTDCRNRGSLKKLYKRLKKERPLYYK
jgi:hypothetical protein